MFGRRCGFVGIMVFCCLLFGDKRRFLLGGWAGVQKERMLAEDMYVLSGNGSILSAPLPKPYPHKPPKCSDCAPLFMKVYFLSFTSTFRSFVCC